MTFADLGSGARVFLDANTLVYHFGPHPLFQMRVLQISRRRQIATVRRQLAVLPVCKFESDTVGSREARSCVVDERTL